MRPRAKTFTLDPRRMAALWRAYYDRNITSGLILMVRLSREQFKLSWTDSLRGAYHILRATEIVDAITEPAPAPAGDWRRVEENLPLAYQHMVERYESV